MNNKFHFSFIQSTSEHFSTYIKTFADSVKASHDLLKTKSTAEKRALLALAQKLVEQIEISYAAKLRDLKWFIADDSLNNTESIDGSENFEEDINLVCRNISNFSIEGDNKDLSQFAKCLALVSENIIELEMIFPEDANLFSKYLDSFNFQLLNNVKKLSLLNTGEAVIKIPESVRQLKLRNCNIQNIDLPESLEEIEVVGGPFHKSQMKSITVPKQKWIDQEVNINEVGTCNEFSNTVEFSVLNIVVEPLRIGSNDWKILEPYFRQYEANGDKIDHLFIDGESFDEKQCSDLISIGREAKPRSLKILTKDKDCYKTLIQNVKTADQFGHQIIELVLLADSIYRAFLEQFYYNRDTQFMYTDDYNFFLTQRKSLKYLVLDAKVFDLHQIDDFLDYCKEYNFLKLISPHSDVSKRIQELSLIEGTHIFYQYFEILKKAQRTEVIFKQNEKNIIEQLEGFVSISSNDTTYRFEFGKDFQFQYKTEIAPSTFLKNFVTKLSVLHNMERIEFVSQHSNFNPFINFIANNFTKTKKLFSNLTKLSHISIELSDNLSEDFGFVLSSFPAVQYVTVKYRKHSKVFNQSFDRLRGQFMLGTGQNWHQLPFLGNRLANHFTFANENSMNPTNEQMKNLLQTSSLADDFAKIIQAKRPDVFPNM